METPRPEHPRPQFVRDQWLCLNGQWQFEIDPGNSGLERGLRDRPLSMRITVPFCPESDLSGIGHRDFMAAVWYRRDVRIPAEWAGRRVLLHFQAVDYDATVWADGLEVARHRGGFTPFTCDLGVAPTGGRTVAVVVRARDDARQLKPRGKQSDRYENYGCVYTRTTGIWQTVWMEAVPADVRLLRARITPDVARGRFLIEQPLAGRARGLTFRATLLDEAGHVCRAETPADADFSPRIELAIPADRLRLWEPGDGHLYDVELELVAPDGSVVDRVASYAGLRSITIDGLAVKINGRTVFQRLVLDQGYYPDGIMTAPTDEALRRDIELSFEAGFNGARLHQKVFEERFLWHADRMGYLVWGEFPDWGCRDPRYSRDGQLPGPEYIAQWAEALQRDYSHPSIIGWCPLNETWQRIEDYETVLDTVTRGMFAATKAADTTRPVLDASGYSHRVPETDVYDSHDYNQDPAVFRARHDGILRGEPFLNTGPQRPDGSREPWSVPWRGQPYFVSEFGGIWWNPDAREGEDSWGYGQRPKSLEEFYTRFEGLVAALRDNPMMFGYCYTQLTDVYQEQNGIYRFDRSRKFDIQRVRDAQQQPAAIETDAD